MDSGPIVVSGEDELLKMVADLRSPNRMHPVVGLSSSPIESEPALVASEVREIVGPFARIYLLPNEDQRLGLKAKLGRKLALFPDTVRVWWPGLTRRSDPGDHPLVAVLEGESGPDLLAEFGREFELSRPHIRREIKQIEDARALAEHRCKQAEEKEHTARERLRDSQVERHREALRAVQAEEKLEAVILASDQDPPRAGAPMPLVALGRDRAEAVALGRAFGPRVKTLRVQAGLTQTRLAALCFVRDAQVSLIERGLRMPGLATLLLLADALGVSVAELMEGLPATTRAAGRVEVLALITQEPGIKKEALVASTGLPSSYVRGIVRYLEARGDIIDATGQWEAAQPPSSDSTKR
jgi:transcriptional regulator with XRE-family HTH domain